MSTRFVVLIAVLAISGALASPCAPCTLAQCQKQGCGSAAPYACLAGMDAGGCSANPDAWNTTAMCTSCCDASVCSSLPRFQCNATCSAAMCHSMKRCVAATPYMCTSGSAEYGCSASSAYWPTMPQCDSCCDISSCEETCTTCTQEQCQANPCTPASPYVCTSGPLKSACSNSSSYFGTQSQCYTCCDASSCGTARFNCTSTVCPQSVCRSESRCALSMPYECVGGSAANGCSASPSYWPTYPQCSSCCDIKTCEFTCPPCTETQCNSNPCTPWDPYVCTAGPLQNGCAAEANYFGQQSQCYSCCDSSNCTSTKKH